ncbi:hypothetical protein [Chryseosolibacter indicus]|uniref:T9SS type A sorting domain-containing protein n=1 Tax=Chryseosolibacter indicus TaxID=2782351 RepID=A0ABS5VU55_9BACT|nr:hypothetical protein [Chryseosolibacter indicus]MBT1704955.1 hypothetical protein [Chryseosolibacter indicus]
MKFKSLIIAALVMVVSSAVAFAGEDEPKKTGLAVFPVKGTEVFKLVYKGETTGKVKLNIYNASGALILTEVINGVDGFICPLNFTGLANGEYTVEVIDALGKKAEKVVYQPKRSIKHIHVSKMNNEAGKFLVAIANTGSDVINLKIYDNNNNLVYSESKEISGDFAQLYKLANVSPSYTFEVTDKTGYTKSIKF